MYICEIMDGGQRWLQGWMVGSRRRARAYRFPDNGISRRLAHLTAAPMRAVVASSVASCPSTSSHWPINLQPLAHRRIRTIASGCQLSVQTSTCTSIFEYWNFIYYKKSTIVEYSTIRPDLNFFSFYTVKI